MRPMQKNKSIPFDLSNVFDVVVVGGGNAALCAAITAREAGATVLLLESSPREFRGGNSRHTRNLRYLHESANSHLTGPYVEDEFWKDLLAVTRGQTTEELARHTIRESNNIGLWMAQHGARFQPAMRGTLHLARTNAFFLGGGKALINAYYATAERLGVSILYDATVEDLELCDGLFSSAAFDHHGTRRTARGRGRVETASLEVTEPGTLLFRVADLSGGLTSAVPVREDLWGVSITGLQIEGVLDRPLPSPTVAPPPA